MSDQPSGLSPEVLTTIRRGCVIPAVPLALNANRQFDERRQRALIRYYIDSGVGGIAVGMHFTCLLYTSPSPRDRTRSRMPSSA